MLQTLKDLFDALVPAAPASGQNDDTRAIQLATAVLLVEVMRSDSDLDDAEKGLIASALRERFELAEDELARLLELAEETARTAYDYHAFTSRINASFDVGQKVRMIEHMWRVAYADGQLSALENHVMRKIADLLYVPHGAYINAKMRAKQASMGT